MLVPPTMKKSFEKFPKLGFIWSLAFRELKDADKIVFFGTSFPKSDYMIRWLVREAMMSRKQAPELVIVNLFAEKERLPPILKRLTGDRKARWFTDFNEYLNGGQGEII
ncbi:MAG: hypothetical protein V3S39_00670 [Thermodesulfobacteriota bacterium]